MVFHLGVMKHLADRGLLEAVAKVSKATATRHLADLLARGCLVKLPGGGRSTRYQILWPADGAAQTPEHK